MSTAANPRTGRTGTVKVRVLGDKPGIAAFLAVLRAVAGDGELEANRTFDLLDQTDPRPNHREPGYRVYVTLRFPPGEVSQIVQPRRGPMDPADVTRWRGAAPCRQAKIRRPAAPPPAKESKEERHLP